MSFVVSGEFIAGDLGKFYVLSSLQDYPSDIYHRSSVVISHQGNTAVEYEPAFIYFFLNDCFFVVVFCSVHLNQSSAIAETWVVSAAASSFLSSFIYL